MYGQVLHLAALREEWFFPRLNGISSRIIRVAAAGSFDPPVFYEIIGKKSEIDAAPVLLSGGTVSGHNFRYGNLISPTFKDETAIIITDDIKTVLIDDDDTTVNTETVTDGHYTEIFARHTDVPTVSGYRLSNGTQYAPYSLNCFSWGRAILSQVIELEDTFDFDVTLLPDILLTETNKSTVDAYTTLDNAQELYDRAASYLYDNYIGETAPIVSREGNQIVLGAVDLVIDATAASVITFSSGTLTIKSSDYIAGAKATTGTVTLNNGADISSGQFDCDVFLNSEVNFASLTINGDLHINTGADSVISFTNVVVTGDVFNDDTSHTLTINASGSSLTADNPGTGNGQTNILQSITLTVEGNVTLDGAEVRIYDYNGTGRSLGDELDGVENNTGATFDTTEINSGNQIWIQILKSGYVEFGQTFTMPATNTSFQAELTPETNA
jgi:hypothetical protein